MTGDGCSGSSSGNTFTGVVTAAELANDIEVELPLVMAVFAEVLPYDVGCAKGCMGPPCGGTVIIFPFFIFVFLAAGSFNTAGSFDAYKINGTNCNTPQRPK